MQRAGKEQMGESLLFNQQFQISSFIQISLQTSNPGLFFFFQQYSFLLDPAGVTQFLPPMGYMVFMPNYIQYNVKHSLCWLFAHSPNSMVTVNSSLLRTKQLFLMPCHSRDQSIADSGWWVSAGPHKPLSSSLQSWDRWAPCHRKEACNLLPFLQGKKKMG